VCGILRVFLISFQYRTAASISSSISSKAFKKIINQEYVNIKSVNQSKFLSILIQDIPRTSESISNCANLVSNIIILIFISFSLLVIETRLFLISGLFIALSYLLIGLTFAKKLKVNGENITKYNHKETSLARSTMASIVDFIISGSSAKQIKTFRNNEIELRNSYANTLIYSQTPRYIVETVCLSLFTFFILISISSKSSLLIFAQLGTLLFAFNRVLPAAQQTFSAYAFIKSSSSSINNVNQVLSLKEKKNISALMFKNNNLFNENRLTKNKINLIDLAFQYNKNKKFKFENFEFIQGIPTAIIGKSGSGKTTLIELILKLLDPTNGEIKINNQDINKIDLKEYYRNISYLSQSPFLFSGSLYENIMFGSNDEIDKDLLFKNGEKLGLKDEFGDNFLDYYISDFGRNISGGQAQRCSLLKIASNIKPIIIIDEPSSALDQKTSMIFTDLLLSKAKDSILIVITHSREQAELFPAKLYL
jgi:ATP-binding cassette subfamily B protein